jgi:hypothetical protein
LEGVNLGLMSGFFDWRFIDEDSVSQLENCCEEQEVKR